MVGGRFQKNMSEIKIRRLQLYGGTKANLPLLKSRELGYCVDSEQLYIGNGQGNLNVCINQPIIPVLTLPDNNSREDHFYWVMKEYTKTVAGEDTIIQAGLYFYQNGTWNHVNITEPEFKNILGDAYDNSNLSTRLDQREYTILQNDEDGKYGTISITRGDHTNPITSLKINQIDDTAETSTTKTYSIDKIIEMIHTISTTFRGSFDTYADLIAYTGDKDENDTASVATDETHDNQCWMYQYVSGNWVAKYMISDQAYKPLENGGIAIDKNNYVSLADIIDLGVWG